jgi:ribonuclease BN (tRNA processing enzyme)
MHAARVILLGTGGGPIDRQRRSQPATLLVVDGFPYLIDAGAGVVMRIAQAGYEPVQISKVFITHHHPDHDAGLAELLSFIWIGRNSRKLEEGPVQLYGPPATNFLLQSALNSFGVSERIFSAEMSPRFAAKSMFEAQDIARDGMVFRDSRVCVIAVENTHYRFPKESAAYRAGDKSYSYRFNTIGGSVVFTGDTGPSEAVTHLADHADLLISEVISVTAMEARQRNAHLSPEAQERVAFHMQQEHLAPEEIGRMAAHANVKAVLLTHFVPGLDSEHDATIYTRGVGLSYLGPVIPGRDLFEYDLYKHGSSAEPSCE